MQLSFMLLSIVCGVLMYVVKTLCAIQEEAVC